MSTRDSGGRFPKGVSGRAFAKAARPPGVTGVAAYAGYVSTGETNSALSGSQKWVTLANASNKAVVATGLRYFFRLIAGTEWHAEENKAGGDGAAKGVEVVEQGLLNAPMLKPWPRVAAKAGMFHPFGFSLHATAMRRRADGLVVFSAIEHRPQFTIEKWLRDAEDKPFHSVVQRSKETGKEITIPLDECFYCVDDMLTDSPEGVGLLRHCLEYVRRLDLFEKWEGHAFEGDLNGTPYTRAPLGEIAATAGTEDAGEIKSKTDAITQTSRDFMAKRHKSPESPQWHMLDSAVYPNPDGTLTSVPKWQFEIIKGETANLAQLDATIRRVELQIARVLGIEWALMGSDGGSYAMHDDKTSTFESAVDDTLRELGGFATMQLARRLVAANGLDPDTCTPRLVAAPIGRESVEKVTRSLAALAMAGLHPEDPAINVLREQMGLPPQPDSAAVDLMLPRDEGDVDEGEDPTGAEGMLDGTSPNATDTSTPTQPGATPALPDGTAVQDTALNGAQVQAAVDIAISVASGEIAPEAGKLMLVQFFQLPPDVAASIVSQQVAHAKVPEDVPAAPLPPTAIDKAKQKTLAALLSELGGKCAKCKTKNRLEVHHVNGRDWEPNELSRSQRVARYWREYEEGVEMQALCRSCNASDGAKNKQEH